MVLRVFGADVCPAATNLTRRRLLAVTAGIGAALMTTRWAHADGGLGGFDGPAPDPPGALQPAIRGAQHQETPLPAPPTRPTFQPGEVVWSIATTRRIVVLSFDDGPDPVHDLALANILRARGYEGRATFFSIGRNVASFPGVTKELFDRGYTIGNHTMTHSQQGAVGEAGEIGPCQEVIQRVTGEYPWAFRAAGGTKSPTINAECAARGLVYIWTDGDENDWKSPRLSPDEINARFIHYLHPGYISLRHSGGTHDNTVAAMHPMLDIIEANGYEVTTLADALAIRDGDHRLSRSPEHRTDDTESADADGPTDISPSRRPQRA